MLETNDFAVSLWQEAHESFYSPLDCNLSADVCVIGAGIVGLTTAYYLSAAGQSVVVIDSGIVGGRQTLRTSAHLSNVMDDGLSNLVDLHGLELSKKVVESHTWAIDEIEEIALKEKTDCGFKRLDGYLFLGRSQSEAFLKKEMSAALRLGLEPRFMQDFSNGDFSLGPALKFGAQATFEPAIYAKGLAKAVVRLGGQIFSRTRAVKLSQSATAIVELANQKHIHAKSVVLATNVPVGVSNLIHFKQSAYRSYVLAAKISPDTFPDCLMWDTEEPYHYVRKVSRDNQDYLLVGGEDHRVGQLSRKSKHPHLQLYRWAKEKFPFIGKVAYSWSGQIIESHDYLANSGRLAGSQSELENLFVGSADSGQGLTYGTLAGRIISDQILNIKNVWSEIYNPDRFTGKALGSLVANNANSVFQYKDWLKIKEKSEKVNLPKRGGAICSEGLQKVAVYRDEDGRMHRMSAVCPHLGGIVSWNETGKNLGLSLSRIPF